jgi:hypothetical protein
MDCNLLDVIEDTHFSYSLYRELIDNFLSKDNRELNYQNRVIIPMLEKIFANNASISAVDVSTQYKNWNNRIKHDRSKYAGKYTPDVLIAKNWHIDNRDNDKIDYRVLIEVKKPNANDRQHALCEVNDYLNHVSNVILTDLITWEFYRKDGEEIDIVSFTLEEKDHCAKVCERGINNKTVRWKELEVKTSEFLVKELGFPQKMKENPVEWGEIMKKLKTMTVS